MSELGAYRHVWTKRDRRGDWEYEYECYWSDGEVTTEVSLPWGRLEGVLDLGLKAC